MAAPAVLPLQGKISYPAKIYSIAGGKQAPVTLLEKGQQYLSQGQYAKAEDCFRQSSVEHPADAVVHYYLANALVYLKKHSEAMSEYRNAFLLDPYGPVSGYCRKALTAYRQRAEESATASSEANISAAERIGLKTKDDGHRGKSVQCIRDQVEREKSRHHVYADSIAATIVRGGESRAQTIEKNTHDAINETLNSPLKLRPFENPLTAMENRRMQIEQMRRESEDAAKLERSQAAERSNTYKNWSQQHDSSLDEIASNLEELLSTKSLPGSAQLHPEGTGLFVRYYGGGTSAQDVHNSVAHFSSHGFVPDSKTDADGAQNIRSEHPNESTVRGAVIR